MPDGTASKRDTLGGLLRIVAAAVIWGTIPLVLRASDGSSIVKVFFRMALAGLVVTIYMIARGRMREVTSMPRRMLVQLAAQGVLLTVNWALFISALDMTNVATAELLGYTGPIFVATFAPLVTREPFDRRIVLPLLLALSGIAVILAPQGIGVASPREMLGAALAFCSALTYAALLLRSKKLLRGVSSGPLMVVEYAVASVILLPFTIWFYMTGQGPTGVGSYVALVTLGVVHTAVAGVFFLGGLRRVRTDHAAVIMYVEPVSAVLFAAAFLGERIGVWTLLGGALVVLGGFLVARLEPTFGPEAADAASVEVSGEDGDPVG